MALTAPLAETFPRPENASHLRRCTFRRLIRVDAGPPALYDVECLYPTRQVSIPLGDLETARPICNACVATGVFRPDEE